MADATTNEPTRLREVLLASPRGFCAGVVRAIEIVERALEKYGAPVYVKHAIVHNRHVVERLRAMGAVFVEELAEVPAGAPTIFSAHGVSPAVYEEAERRALEVVDATCPLVTKVHREARLYAGQNRTIFLIGHKRHVEVQGTYGEAPERTIVIENAGEAETVTVPDAERVAYLTQTTLSLDDTAEIVAVLQGRFPALRRPRKQDICYATQNRQHAVRALAEAAEVILVVGSAESSNSNRLVDVARAQGVAAYLIESEAEFDPAWLAGAERVGVTAGASAPEEIVQDLVGALARRYGVSVRELEVVREETAFPLPRELMREENRA